MFVEERVQWCMGRDEKVAPWLRARAEVFCIYLGGSCARCPYGQWVTQFYWVKRARVCTSSGRDCPSC